MHLFPVKPLHSLLLILILGVPLATYAEELRSKFVIDPGQVVEEIVWDLDQSTQEPVLVLDPESSPTTPSFYVELKGKVSQTDSNLIFDSQAVQMNKNSEFSLKVPVHSNKEEFQVLIIDPKGSTLTQHASLVTATWEEFIAPQAQLKRLLYSVELGTSAISYQQSGSAGISELGLTLKLSGDYKVKGPWRLNSVGYFTLLPFYGNIQTASIRFLEIAVRAVLKVIEPKRFVSSWDLDVAAGLQYLAAFSSSSSIGYLNLMSPQILGKLARQFSHQQMLWLALIYSPTLTGSNIFDLSNAHFRTELGYTFSPLKSGRLLGITGITGNMGIIGSIAVTRLQFDQGQIQANSYTLGFTYQF